MVVWIRFDPTFRFTVRPTWPTLLMRMVPLTVFVEHALASALAALSLPPVMVMLASAGIGSTFWRILHLTSAALKGACAP